ncbi:MAG: N2,N2-dimethylguanosine tRNA methyltransferase [Candidatus Methanomethylophilaceae archaeon]|jgi:tRNA (guanine26-N2/guanine27-N2)-dimethyltransferase
MSKTVVVKEGGTLLSVPSEHSSGGPGKKNSEIFFNEQMAFNRDVSVMLLRSLSPGITVADAMTATGARAARIANEVIGTEVTANDINPGSMEYVKKNIELNGLGNCTPSNKDLHILFSEHAFGYVDLDPFGSPAPFIQSAIRGCSRKGILGITATDTAPLAGAHSAKCRRRYQSEPVRGYMCHEGGLRILMCTIARELAKFDRGMAPMLSFSADHYYRTYVRVTEGAKAADRTLSQLGYMRYDTKTMERSISSRPDEMHRLGPFWTGNLHDPVVLNGMSPEGMADERRCRKMLDLWRGEIDSEVFVYDLSELSSHIKMSPPKIEVMIDALCQYGRASRTHISPTSFKTDLPLNEIVDVYRSSSPDARR